MHAPTSARYNYFAHARTHPDGVFPPEIEATCHIIGGIRFRQVVFCFLATSYFCRQSISDLPVFLLNPLLCLTSVALAAVVALSNLYFFRPSDPSTAAPSSSAVTLSNPDFFTLSDPSTAALSSSAVAFSFTLISSFPTQWRCSSAFLVRHFYTMDHLLPLISRGYNTPTKSETEGKSNLLCVRLVDERPYTDFA